METTMRPGSQKGKEAAVKRFILVLATTLVALSLAASAAFAQSPTERGYGGQGGAAAEVEGGGGLPFTGLDIGLLVGGGVVLVLVGMTIRRLSRAS
jgi:hypothetical protein